MNDDDFAVIHGSGNVFEDLGLPNAEMEQARAMLAAAIGKTLTMQGIGPREAERRTGVAASEFSRIRKANLERFTIDRLMTILDLLGQRVQFSIDVQPKTQMNAHEGLFPA
jgi:predicted XRE-type DNA-binding protein